MKKAKKAPTYLRAPENLTIVQVLQPEGENGGYDAETKLLVPMRNLRDDDLPGCYIFDTIAAAFEAGVLLEDAWATQLFETEEDIDYFLEMLEDYDCYRIWDSWYIAFGCLAHGNRFSSDEGFVQSREIADSIREALVETGQLKQFRKAA